MSHFYSKQERSDGEAISRQNHPMNQSSQSLKHSYFAGVAKNNEGLLGFDTFDDQNRSGETLEEREADHNFHLFAGSFDTLSEVDQGFYFSPSGGKNHQSSYPGMSPTPSHLGEFDVFNHRSMSFPADVDRAEIILPQLNHQKIDSSRIDEYGGDQLSLGNISPIKVVFHKECGHKIGALSNPEGFQEKINESRNDSSFCSRDDQRETTEVENCHGPAVLSSFGNSQVSNPFYVLRSSRIAFKSCKYLLPSVRGDDRLCVINVSNAHIHQYQTDQKVRKDGSLLYFMFLVIFIILMSQIPRNQICLMKRLRFDEWRLLSMHSVGAVYLHKRRLRRGQFSASEAIRGINKLMKQFFLSDTT